MLGQLVYLAFNPCSCRVLDDSRVRLRLVGQPFEHAVVDNEKNPGHDRA